jgi:excisionase family DNA binding protein
MMNMLTVKQVAERLNLKTWAVYQNWKQWRLPGIRVGRGKKARIRFPEEEFNKWVESRRVDASVSLAEDQARRMLKAVK